MWYSIPENICENTEISRKSKLIETYLNTIDTSDKINEKCFKKYYSELKNNINNKEPKELKEFHNLILIKGRDMGYWDTIKKIKNIIRQNLTFYKNRMICKNDLISYKDMRDSRVNENIINIIKNFCDFIWKKFYSKENKTEYVKKYIDEISPNKKCMCCGITSLSNGEYNVRSDIDHWLPKTKYPFVSFYKKNLFVICSNCNKKKAVKVSDPVIFPYIVGNFNLKINSISLSGEGNELEVDFEIESDCSRLNLSHYINEWDEFFNIKKLLQKEFKEKIEEYELDSKEKSLEQLKESVNILKFRTEVTKIAYLNYKIKNYDRTR